MKKAYTKKQITEAIAYWKKQLRAGNYRKLHESINTRSVRPGRWYVVNVDTQAENADAETQDRIRCGELRFSDGAVTEMFIDGCSAWPAGFATADEANQAAFEEWGSYTDYDSYEDWLEDQEALFPGQEHLFSVYATNGDPDPMDRFESDIRVMKGDDLVREYNDNR